MSNTFPKVSPDGKWIVFVEAHNGQLMRPDGKLYIVPAAGGAADNCTPADHEFLAQFLAEWTLAGVFVEEPLALHACI